MEKLFEIDEISSMPIWVQLKNRLIYLITSGQYKPGDKLPTVRDIALESKINYNTVNKVYLSLVHDGYIVSQRGRGTFVRDISRSLAPGQNSPTDSVLNMAIKQCLELGVPLEDIVGEVAKRVEKFQDEEELSK